MIQVRCPLCFINNNILTTTSASIDFSGEDNAIFKGNTKRKKLIDDFDIAENEPVSPEVRQRLAKLKDLNDAYNVSDEDFEVLTPSSPKERLRKSKKISSALVQSTKKKVKRASKPTELHYTVEIVLATWNAESDYGKSFRAMLLEDQMEEVKRLNAGTTKGLKGVIKNKLLDENYKTEVTAKMQAYLGESRMPLAKMFHAAPSTLNTIMLNPSFVSVGEWVEVDADRTPGYNSEGGIAVVIAVADALIDVK
jgi:hypothetical protein